MFAGVDRGDRLYDTREADRRRHELERERRRGLRPARGDRAEDRRAGQPGSRPARGRPEALREQLAQSPRSGAGPKAISPSNGYHSAIHATPDVTSWVQVDLGRSMPIEEIRLVPARPVDFADTPGFGFPVRFRVEVSDDPEFGKGRAVAVVDEERPDSRTSRTSRTSSPRAGGRRGLSGSRRPGYGSGRTIMFSRSRSWKSSPGARTPPGGRRCRHSTRSRGACGAESTWLTASIAACPAGTGRSRGSPSASAPGADPGTRAGPAPDGRVFDRSDLALRPRGGPRGDRRAGPADQGPPAGRPWSMRCVRTRRGRSRSFAAARSSSPARPSGRGASPACPASTPRFRPGSRRRREARVPRWPNGSPARRMCSPGGRSPIVSGTTISVGGWLTRPTTSAGTVPGRRIRSCSTGWRSSSVTAASVAQGDPSDDCL